jgi:hypothetical protein
MQRNFLFARTGCRFYARPPHTLLDTSLPNEAAIERLIGCPD